MAASDSQKSKLFFSNLLSRLFHGGGGGVAHQPPQKRPVIHKRLPPAAAKLAVVDVEGALLLPRSLFPYFMLVAVEAGGFLRGLLLLLLYPFILALSSFFSGAGADAAVRAMAFVAFCGLRAARFRAGRAVLPRWLLQDVALQGFDLAVSPARQRRSAALWVSRMPRAMVEPFLKEYLLLQNQESRDDVAGDVIVVAREMKAAWGFYTGFMEDYHWEQQTGVVDDDAIGFSGASSSSSSMEFFLGSLCKEIYTVTDEEKAKWQPLPPRSHPRPVVFHDGRLAFLPTPLAFAATLTWLPMGAVLAVARVAIALSLPYRLATPLLAATGQSWRLRGSSPPPSPEHVNGQLYVCNHRTLIDPVYVSIALNRPVRAVSYSLSRFSDLISPIGATVHLTRDRAHDGAAMAGLLERGSQVVVCPEGTTCREPYLLRFSPLFAELTDGVVPVALAVETAMFHATTAGGWKWLDPLYYLANPRMCYTVEFLPRVETKAAASSAEVANKVQRLVAEALGYECTMLTRKDKYRMLAGNDGVVQRRQRSSMEERNNGFAWLSRLRLYFSKSTPYDPL